MNALSAFPVSDTLYVEIYLTGFWSIMATATEVSTVSTLQNHGERIASLETNQQHLVTKADLANLQATLTWRLILAVSITTTVSTALLGLLIQSA